MDDSLQGPAEPSPRSESLQTVQFRIAELDCAEEVRQLETALGGRRGIADLQFDIFKNRMTVDYDTSLTAPEEIVEQISQIGMRAEIWEPERKQPSGPWWRQSQTLLTLISTVAWLSGTLLHFADLSGGTLYWLGVALYVITIITAFRYVAPKAWASLRNARPDMNLLMTVAVIGALSLGEWFEAATVSWLFCIALLLEHWSMGRARRAIAALMDLSPPTARLKNAAGQTETLPVEEVPLGARILVSPGEKIPLDGVILTGRSSINQAPITGESMPITKEPGQEVYAGTINEDAALEIEVTQRAADSTIARIVNLVEQAQASRAPAQQWVDRFAAYYTPAMMALALAMAVLPPLIMGGGWADWFYRALVVLVIACPCALVISTPVSIVSALTAAARQGVLVKGGRYLEACAALDTFVFDKTGTITSGQPDVQDVVAVNSYSREQLLEFAAALEAGSNHPAARAVCRFADSQQITPPTAAEQQLLAGRGVEATIAGTPYWIGSHRLVHERAEESEEIHQRAVTMEDAGHSVIAVGTGDEVIGLISIADPPRPNAPDIIAALRKNGISRIDLLTGDNEPTAQAIGEMISADHVRAECLPAEKLEQIQQITASGRHVAMVGDGVNDAPALAAATVGIAMGAMGTDVAVESADIALMSDDLSRLPWLVRHARRTLSIVRQNIAVALGLKVVFILLTFFGLSSLWMAIAADMGASLAVIFNGLRLLKGDSTTA